jgi:integrase
VLAAPHPRTVKDLRNRAILLLLARLGLRAGEVRPMSLEDLDRRRGNLRVRAGKTRRERIMLLPEDVGEALIDYLGGAGNLECRPARTGG